MVIQEQNASPGLANKALAMLASRLYVAFREARAAFASVIGPHAAEAKCRLLGNPLRAEITAASGSRPREGLRLLVLGGSLGARALNS